MSTGPLPRKLDFRRAATRQQCVRGSLQPASLPRVAPLLAADEGSIAAEFAFHRDDEGRYLATLAVTAVLSVPCQRCLETVTEHLASHSTLAAVWNDDQARQLPSGLEPVLTGEEETDLWVLVEEELVLALPSFSYHEDRSCIDRLAPVGVEGQVPAVPAQENPFKVLAQLKRDVDKGE